MDSCLYVAPNLGAATTVTEAGLADTTERHRLRLRLGPLTTCLDPLERARRHGPVCWASIVGMERGWPGSSHLRFASAVLRAEAPRLVLLALEQAARVHRRRALAQLLAALGRLHRRPAEAPRRRPGVAAASPMPGRTSPTRCTSRCASSMATRARCRFARLTRAPSTASASCPAPASTCAPTTGRRSPPAAATATPATSPASWRRSPSEFVCLLAQPIRRCSTTSACVRS